MASLTSATVAGAFARYLALASTARHPRDFKPRRRSSWDGSDLAPSGGLAGSWDPRAPRRRERARRRRIPPRAGETRVRAGGPLHPGSRPRTSRGGEGAPSGVSRRRRRGLAVPRLLREQGEAGDDRVRGPRGGDQPRRDRKSTRLNSSHTVISYAVFCLKKKKKTK